MELVKTQEVNRYIAAQGPMQHTCRDFWQVISIKGSIALAYWGMRMYNKAFCFVTQVMNAHVLSQMVWEQESTFIIMLTLITEGGKVWAPTNFVNS